MGVKRSTLGDSVRSDLLHQVGSLRDVTNAILLTHNIDFVFLQSVAMSYLRRCGDPALTILADVDCASESYRAQRELLDGMGTRYRVVPIRMNPGFVFHPKALLLTGPQQATLFVGSGNLTFGGWRQNGEIWSRYTAADDGLIVFDQFRHYVSGLLEGVPLAGSVRSELEDAYDPRTKLWMGTAPAGDSKLIGRAGGEAPLLDTLVATIGAEPIDELVVCSPYFDKDGRALATLRERLPHINSLLLHPGKGSSLTPAAWEHAGSGMTRRPCEIRHEHQMGNRPGYVHAKFYAAVRGDEAIVVQGSANCTLAALLMDGPRGNAELMSVVRTSAEVFRREWLDALPETADTILEEAEEKLDDDETAVPALQILAARAEDGVILAAYHPPAAVIKGCLIGGKPVSFSTIEPGRVHIAHLGAAPALILEGQIYGAAVASPPHWVDQEHQLRATARRRRLEETIPRTIGGERWTSDQWVELLQSLGEHLKYTPVRIGGNNVPPPRQSMDPSGATRRYEDIFSKDYSPDTMLAHWKNEMPIGEAHDSVRKLLLRWLGIGQEESAPVTASDLPPPGATSQGDGDQEEEIPPRPLAPPKPMTSSEITEKMREKLRRILADIEATVTATAYLELRPPDFLRSDLMMMSVILRFGYARGWLSNEAFFGFTHAVWVSLFLSCEKDSQRGWLEWRRSKSPDPMAFTAAIACPQLSAALIAWTLIGLDAGPSIERARFLLARALSAAKMPELWFGGSVEAITQELADVLRASTDTIDPERLVAMWRETLSQGVALRSIGELLECLSLEDARGLIVAPTVGAGELLWQGNAGYCITVEAGRRDAMSSIKTLKLQLMSSETRNFVGAMTLPIRELLKAHEFAGAADAQHLVAMNELLLQVSSNLAEGARA
jgi:hypothetical protein